MFVSKNTSNINLIQDFELAKFSQVHLQAASVSVNTKWCIPHRIDHQQFITFLTTLGNSYIVGGDFNSKHLYWGSRLTTPKGRQLLQALNITNCIPILTGKPTYWPTDCRRRPDLIAFPRQKNSFSASTNRGTDRSILGAYTYFTNCCIRFTMNARLVNKQSIPTGIVFVTNWIIKSTWKFACE